MDYLDPVSHRTTRRLLRHYKLNFIISPEQWETLAGLYTTLNWQKIKFERTNSNRLPQVEGLYMFAASPEKINASFINYLFYIGETNDLKRRYGEYLDKIDNPKSSQYKVYEIIDDYPNHLYFHYVEFPGFNETQRKSIEDQFLVGFLPPINSKYPQGLQKLVLAAYAR